ncbi:MAG: tetratricopeptide repeat protein [Gemmatimonadetes bacterium]|nr:tetratricopeptide repeat protein [Gemmatimonadota bacterium]
MCGVDALLRSFLANPSGGAMMFGPESSVVRERGVPNPCSAGRYEEHVHAGRTSVLERDFDAARAHLKRAVQEDGRRPEAFNLLGVIEQVRGRGDEARECWRMALALRPDYQAARANLRWARENPRMRGALALECARRAAALSAPARAPARSPLPASGSTPPPASGTPRARRRSPPAPLAPGRCPPPGA